MIKKIAHVAGAIAALAIASPAQAQWSTFTPNNNGSEFWDNASTDGTNCNIGYVVTGVAGTAGNFCGNQRPTGWLPYTGPAMSDFYTMPTFSFYGGMLTLNIGAGLGGDVAGENRSWGFWQVVGATKQFTNLNTVVSTTTYNFLPGQSWGFWVNTTDNVTRTSDVDAQFALFRGANSRYLIGLEDTTVPGGDRDYQDMIASVTIVPEPASAALVLSGLAGLAGIASRRRRA